MTVRTHYSDIDSYITRDGSEIRELMHPAVHGNRHQSLAEAIIPAGGETLSHRHHHTEELYHITVGAGLMYLGDQQFSINVGDTVCIPPGTAHNVRNTGNGPLHILCCCSPAYSHEDTELLTQTA